MLSEGTVCVFKGVSENQEWSKKNYKSEFGRPAGAALRALVGELWQVAMDRVYLYPLQHPV